MTNQQPPHSLPLERAVLSCVLSGKDAGAMALVRQHIPHALVFFGRSHRFIWTACEDLDDAGKPVTMEQVAERLAGVTFQKSLERINTLQKLQDNAHLDGMSKSQKRAFVNLRQEDYTEDFNDSALASIGGYSELAEVLHAHYTMKGLEVNAKTLRDYYDRRTLLRTLSAVNAQTYAADSAAKAYEGIVASLARAMPRIEGEDLTVVSQVADGIIDAEAAIYERGDWGIDAISKHHRIDLRRNSMPVIAGTPGTGKTSLAVQVARYTAKARNFEDGAVAFASLEVSATEITQWMLAQAAGVSFSAVEDKTWDSTQRERARQSISTWGESVTINDGMLSTAQSICQWARAHKRKYGDGFQMLVVDHLHSLQPSKPNQSEYEMITEACGLFKWLRRELNICVFLLCQLNRQGADKKPTMASLRASGAIEQDATSVVLLHRDKEKGVSHIIIPKNRFGPTGEIEAGYNPFIGGVWGKPLRPEDGGGDPYGITAKYGGTRQPLNTTKGQSPTSDEDLFS